jgi:signal-transduction protein with cAMP-binding, CBS, and nucleotidyltransferase domain
MNLKEDLHTEQVTHLDLNAFCQVESTSTVKEVVEMMRAENVNVCLIMEKGILSGILTDRDVLRRIAAHPEKWAEPVTTVMTPSPITIDPSASAAEALWLMDEKRIRNLPAVDGMGKVVGNMTHQAIINYLAARYPIEILNLPPRPDQIPEQVEGG